MVFRGQSDSGMLGIYKLENEAVVRVNFKNLASVQIVAQEKV